MTLSRREQTELRIMQAFEDQILGTGMMGVGINAIAKRAGVSKELIYRYFDGLPGLMLQWMYNQDFWTGKSAMLFGQPPKDLTSADGTAQTMHPAPASTDNANQATQPAPAGTDNDEQAAHSAPASANGAAGPAVHDSRAVVLAMLRAQAQALFDNKALREIRRWELIEENELSVQLAKRRESVARAFIDRLSAANPESPVDIPATVGILLAGVLYLVLRSKTECHFLGVPIRTEDGWERLFDALDHLIQSLPDEPVHLPQE